MIGRFAGESNDCPKVQYKQTKKGGEITEDPNRTYLDLSKEEEDLLRYLGVSYKNVILVLNTGNVMALGAIERLSGIDACLYAGRYGRIRSGVLPEILWGRVSPSGRTTDTWLMIFPQPPATPMQEERVWDAIPTQRRSILQMARNAAIWEKILPMIRFPM